MTDVLNQALTGTPAYAADRAEKIRPDVETFLNYCRNSSRAGGETTFLPPIRIGVDALRQLVAALREPAAPDNCPLCGRLISDLDPDGREDENGQRHCADHVPDTCQGHAEYTERHEVPSQDPGVIE